MSGRKTKKIDKTFLGIILFLTIGGFFIFLSAAMGLLARDGGQFSSVITNQSVALGVGLVGLTLATWIHYSWWKKLSLPLFLVAIFLCLLLFIPALSLEHGGAVRWLTLGPITLQPAEFLKGAFVIYCAAWLAGVRNKVHYRAYGLIPLVLLFGVTGGLLLLQPDTNSFVFIVVAGVSMFFAVGARLRDVLLLILAGLVGFIGLLFLRPYVLDRLVTLFQRDADMLGSSYQIQQSLIAIGSGEIWGRGFGQSIQKFNFLPEAIGDSIFSVAAEEFGFLGSVLLVGLFTALLFKGLQIAARAPDIFSRLVVVGIVIMITIQAFSNIAGLIEVFPLSGTPLPFVSHGGTALVVFLIMVGIILNISRYQRAGARTRG